MILLCFSITIISIKYIESVYSKIIEYGPDNNKVKENPIKNVYPPFIQNPNKTKLLF